MAARERTSITTDGIWCPHRGKGIVSPPNAEIGATIGWGWASPVGGAIIHPILKIFFKKYCLRL